MHYICSFLKFLKQRNNQETELKCNVVLRKISFTFKNYLLTNERLLDDQSFAENTCELG